MRVLAAVALPLLAATAGAQADIFDRPLPDGRWRERPPGAEDASAPKVLADDLRATAAALLADLAEGSTMKVGRRKDAVKNAVMWLRSQQDDDSGRVGQSTGADAGLAAYALASAYTLSTYRSLKPIACKAVGHVLLECDDPARASRFDSSACALALLAAEAAAMPIVDDVRARLVAAIGARAAAPSPGLADLAAQMICRLQVTPARRDQAELDRCAQIVVATAIAAERGPAPDELAILLATTALHRHGGAAWDAWSVKLQRLDATRKPAADSTAATALRAVTLSLHTRHGAVYGVPRPAGDPTRPITVVDDPILIRGEPPPAAKKK